MDKLIVNNQIVDLDGSEVNLVFKSNLFGELDKIEMNYSYSISVPKTVRNATAFEMAGILDSSSFPYRRTRAQLIRDGVQIVDGEAYISGVDADAYNLCLLWGTNGIDAISDAGDLEEMDLGTIQAVATGAGDTIAPAYKSYNDAYGMSMFFARMDGNQGYTPGQEDGSFLLSCVPAPFLRVKVLFDKIFEEAGISYTIENQAAKNLLLRMVTPVAGRNVEADDFAVSLGNGVAFSNPLNHASFTSPKGKDFVGKDVLAISNSVTTGGVNTGGGCLLHFAGKGSCNAVAVIDFLVNSNAITSYEVELTAVVYDPNKAWGEAKNFSWKWSGSYGKNSEDYKIQLYKEISIDFENEDNYVLFRMKTDTKMAGGKFEVIQKTVNFTGVTFQNVGYTAEIETAKNILNMSKINFVKQVCSLLGCCVLPPKRVGDPVRIVNVGDLVTDEAKLNAVDWSGKMVGGERPSSYSYTFSDYAQKNVISYKEAFKEGAAPETGVLVVDNANIDAEKVLCEFDLGHGKDTDYQIFQLKTERDADGVTTEEWERQTPPDAVFQMENRDGECWVTGRGLSPDDVLERMDGAQKMLRRPVIIKNQFLLSALDIANLDVSRLVYLRQTGSYYLILSVETGDTVSEVELIKI